jgi:hypothetical protein
MNSVIFRNIFLLLFLLGYGEISFSQVTEQTLIDETLRINSSSQVRTYTFNFTRTPEQLTSNYQYRFIIQNADGQLHEVPTAQSCQSLPFREKLFCLAQRVINITYNSTLRLKSADVSFNGVEIINSTNFNNETRSTSVILNNVGLQNSINITIKGPRNSFANIKVISQLTPNSDQNPPVLLADVESNSITNNPTINLTVNDSSNTNTEVYKNSQLLFSTTEKNFTLSLTEGLNSFTLKSTDSAGNVAADFLLTNIRLDTTAPVLSHSLAPDYIVAALPTSINFNIYTNESLSSLTINSQLVSLEATGHFYSYQHNVLQTGPLVFNVTAQDLAGNTLNLQLQTTITVDNIAPIINAEAPLVVITDNYLLSVNVVEESNVSTYIKIDSEVIGPFTQKDFSYLIEFTGDGTKNIEITSTDSAGNVAVKNLKITRNTGPLIGQVLSPLPNTSVNSRLVNFVISANKPISQIKINSVAYNYSGLKLTEIATFQFFEDGRHIPNIEITDVFGGIYTSSLRFEIKTNSVVAWNYLECAAE